MKIDKDAAATIIRHEAKSSKPPDPKWVKKVEKLSQLCAEGVSCTHIAFLGTSILAKSVSRNADLFAIKPDHEPDNPNSYSARSLCHGVLVPLSAELGFNIGVTGREPLNNQPYFRMTRLGDDTPVHRGARAAFDYMVSLIQELDKLKNENDARKALRAFIAVRSKHQPRYSDYDEKAVLTPDRLVAVITAFVKENSEGGRRAQAIVAGLLDVFAGTDRVDSGRINDPSRHYPGDVCIRSAVNKDAWEKAFEVRDKPVSENDVHIFGKKCVDMGVREVSVVMVSEKQQRLNEQALTDWAYGFGIGMTLFHGWSEFVNQVLFWSSEAKPLAANQVLRLIHERLVSVEASPESVSRWQTLISGEKK
ncbi:MAG: restriction endonuclease, SacI family [Candidatus Melainabacteria bacterium]|jgi:hypothetical protein|nr:restriction endonuclease, SacI family [Candidatus Melainabacteria bacterium]